MEQRGIDWEPVPTKFVVRINEYGGLDRMLATDELETALKTSQLRALGIVFDADGLHKSENTRWESVRNRCSQLGIAIGESPNIQGFQTILESGIRFGVWMMPDNSQRGMLETFLLQLVPPTERDSPLFTHVKAATSRAKELGANYKAVHRDKALIHTWLAWEDAPGAQLHEAVKFKFLDANSTRADNFVSWFRELYQL